MASCYSQPWATFSNFRSESCPGSSGGVIHIGWLYTYRTGPREEAAPIQSSSRVICYSPHHKPFREQCLERRYNIPHTILWLFFNIKAPDYFASRAIRRVLYAFKKSLMEPVGCNSGDASGGKQKLPCPRVPSLLKQLVPDMPSSLTLSCLLTCMETYIGRRILMGTMATHSNRHLWDDISARLQLRRWKCPSSKGLMRLEPSCASRTPVLRMAGKISLLMTVHSLLDLNLATRFASKTRCDSCILFRSAMPSARAGVVDSSDQNTPDRI